MTPPPPPPPRPGPWPWPFPPRPWRPWASVGGKPLDPRRPAATPPPPRRRWGRCQADPAFLEANTDIVAAQHAGGNDVSSINILAMVQEYMVAK
jgi:hypothetical protein